MIQKTYIVTVALFGEVIKRYIEKSFSEAEKAKESILHLGGDIYEVSIIEVN